MEIFIVFLILAFATLMWTVFGGKETVEETSVVLDYVKFMLSDLQEQEYEYPHLVMFKDKSGRVCKGPVVGGIEKILFNFHDIDGIATDYMQWKWEEK